MKFANQARFCLARAKQNCFKSSNTQVRKQLLNHIIL